MVKIRIKEAAKKAGVTLDQLAEMSGISTSYLSRLATGKRTVAVKHLEAIAEALNISVDELVASGRVPESLSFLKYGPKPPNCDG